MLMSSNEAIDESVNVNEVCDDDQDVQIHVLSSST